MKPQSSAEVKLKKAEELVATLKAEIEAEKSKDFQVIKYKNKEYRIYKWESKPFKDFVCPKGFKWAEALELIELINEDKMPKEEYKYYYSNKLFKKGYWELFKAYLNGDGDWCANNDDLACSNDFGRVVVVEETNGN